MSAGRLVLIDGYSSIFRAFFAIRGLSSSKGEPTNAVLGFHQILRKLLRDLEPDHVGVALDVSRRTVRSELYPEYKAHRSPMPDELRRQVPRIRALLDGYRIPILELESYEADDVLGTLARKATAAGYEVVLVSSDKDLMQLIDEQVSLWHTSREKLYGAAEVEADFGVPPAQVVDVLSLMGDASDNVPGVPGIGGKGAVGLVREYGSLDNLLDQAAEIKRKSYREGLQEHRDQALLSRELVTIHTDLPIDFEPDRLVVEPPDRELLRELFAELELYSLLEEVEGEPEEDAAPATPLASPEAWEAFVAAIEAPAVFLDPADDPPCGLAVAGAETGEVAWADLRIAGMDEAVRTTVEGWLADAPRLVGHDLKSLCRSFPIPEPAAELLDPMLVSYLVRGTRRGHDLDELALELLGKQLPSRKDSGWQGSSPPPLESPGLLVWARERLDAVRRLSAQLAGELTGAAETLYREIEGPLLPILAAMEARGIRLDTAFLAALSEELGTEIDGLEEEIHQLAGHPFNVQSPQQLGEVLFEELGLPVLKRTKKTKAYSTGADVLEELAARGFELPERILRFRELAKLKSTYVDALPPLVADDGRLHTRYQQAVASTGRLSSVDPNLQNIPVRTETGRRIRRAFVAEEGHLLLVADYSQIELRVLAHIAADEALISAFREGLDIHRATAARVLGVLPDLVDDEQRRAAKTINFGIIYGMSAFGLARNLGVSRADAQSFIDAYFQRYPGVARYMEETAARAEEEGKVETLFGRCRWIPDLASRNRGVREAARRMAINARIQGTAADLLKMAMIAVERRLRRDHPETALLLTVHDELVLEVPETAIEPVAAAVREEMEGVSELSVPLVVDTGWAANWYEAKA